MTTHLVSDYFYSLPEDCIAQFPVYPRDHSKLLVVRGHAYEDHFFYDLPNILSSDDLLFFNNTAVVNARIYLADVRIVFGSKQVNLVSGEMFFLRSLDEYHFEAMISPAKHFRVGAVVFLSENVFCSVESITFGGRIFACSCPVTELLITFGSMPLPPYITYDASKALAYQTIFATNPGSVAAPTASLHFTTSLLHSLSQVGIGIHYLTLHVGISTFKPLVHDIVTDNVMHAEYVELSLGLFADVALGYLSSKRIIAVGTTVCRVLESLPFVWVLFPEAIKFSFTNEVVEFRDRLSSDVGFFDNPVDRIVISGTNVLSFYTMLFIYPGFSFRIVGGLVTNFHLPQSSLLFLVAAFLGNKDYLLSLYEHAISSGYKFYSFGDAMLLI